MVKRGTVFVGVGLLAVALLVAYSTAGSLHSPITQADSGRTFHLGKSGTTTLHLGERWRWTMPKVSSSTIGLTQIQYLVDPGYTGWSVTAHVPGRATITSTGTPACDKCGLAVRRFKVTIVVGS